MPKAEKIERVAALKERLQASDAVLLTEYRGLSVSDITELRRSLAEGGARFSVVKNTLLRRAATDAAMAELESFLDGPTAVAFVEGDPVAAAKKVVEAIKKYPTLVLKGGYMDGRSLSAEDARSLADLESREVMLSKIAGLMKGEMSRAVSLFQAAQSRFVSLLHAYEEKLPGEAVAEAEVSAAPPADESVTEEAPTEEAPTEEAPTEVAGAEAPEANASTEAEASGEEEE